MDIVESVILLIDEAFLIIQKVDLLQQLKSIVLLVHDVGDDGDDNHDDAVVFVVFFDENFYSYLLNSLFL